MSKMRLDILLTSKPRTRSKLVRVMTELREIAQDTKDPDLVADITSMTEKLEVLLERYS